MHEVVEPLSSLWWGGMISSAVGISLFIFILKKTARKNQEYFMRMLSIAFFCSWMCGHYYALEISESWSLEYNLPFHLCRMSIIIAMIALWKPRQWMYEWLLFVSIPSGLHSLLTPEFTQGFSAYLIFDYYFVHAGLIFVPLFLTFVRGMKPRKDGWKRAFLYVQIPFVIIFPLNFILGSNYMYLAQKPMVDNPFLIGEWPWYIIGLEVVLLLHIVVIYLPFRWKNCLKESV